MTRSSMRIHGDVATTSEAAVSPYPYYVNLAILGKQRYVVAQWKMQHPRYIL